MGLNIAHFREELGRVEAACADLGLDEDTTEFVLASHRHHPGLLHTMIRRGADHRAYVESKLILRASLNGQPEPTFPPRKAR